MVAIKENLSAKRIMAEALGKKMKRLHDHLIPELLVRIYASEKKV